MSVAELVVAPRNQTQRSRGYICVKVGYGTTLFMYHIRIHCMHPASRILLHAFILFQISQYACVPEIIIDLHKVSWRFAFENLTGPLSTVSHDFTVHIRVRSKSSWCYLRYLDMFYTECNLRITITADNIEKYWIKHRSMSKIRQGPMLQPVFFNVSIKCVR